jgi:hypothetical protein
MPTVALARIRRSVAVIAQIGGRHDPKRPNRRQRAGFGPPQRVLGVSVVDDVFPIEPAREIEIAHEHVARVETVSRSQSSPSRGSRSHQSSSRWRGSSSE